MKGHLKRLGLISFVLAAPLTAQGGDVPQAVVSGFDAYKSGGANQALATWNKNSLYSVDSAAFAQTERNMRDIEDHLGRVVGYDLLGQLEVGHHVRRVYVELLHERGPSFYEFVIYETQNGWKLLGLRFNSDPRQVLPDVIWPK